MQAAEVKFDESILNENERKKFNDIRIALYNNISAAYLKEVDQEIMRCKRAVKSENERKKKLYEKMLGVKNDTWTSRFGWAAVVGVTALGAALALRFFNARQ
uniref:Uncharacterized protein n=1 Tax=Romanomermis culicivorax TaxID=13658 RepID=A0A915JD55_ROMCU